MRIPKFTHFVAVTLLMLAAFAVPVSAQVVTAEGTVKLKQANGTEVPLKDAVVKFYRIDIKQEFTAKTDKNGRYVNAGIPLTGTFTIAFSGPGAQPTYLGNVKISNSPANSITLDPGDGSMLTLEQIKAASAGAGAGAGVAKAGGAPAMSAAEIKKLNEEAAKERAEIEAKNAKVVERNEKLPVVFKAANEAFTAKKYDESIALFDQAIAIDPNEAVIYRNKMIVLRARAVDKFNAAAKAKDQAGKDSARADLKLATETGEKALSVYRTPQANRVAPATPDAAKAEDLEYLFQRAESYRVALQTNAQVDTEAGVKAFQEYIAAETDQAKRTKAEAALGDALFFGGRVDESIAAYKSILASNPNNLDAIYGLGLALASDPTGAKTAEGRDMLQQFASKAPATDPRKQMAEEAIAGLNEALKPKPADKATTTTRRRKS
jgi:tetratricopeptide (TPR) repeat protein